jgi:hypothetical protein
LSEITLPLHFEMQYSVPFVDSKNCSWTPIFVRQAIFRQLDDPSVIMIGSGTGLPPFRTFLKVYLRSHGAYAFYVVVGRIANVQTSFVVSGWMTSKGIWSWAWAIGGLLSMQI